MRLEKAHGFGDFPGRPHIRMHTFVILDKYGPQKVMSSSQIDDFERRASSVVVEVILRLGTSRGKVIMTPPQGATPTTD